MGMAGPPFVVNNKIIADFQMNCNPHRAKPKRVKGLSQNGSRG